MNGKLIIDRYTWIKNSDEKDVQIEIYDAVIFSNNEFRCKVSDGETVVYTNAIRFSELKPDRKSVV